MKRAYGHLAQRMAWVAFCLSAGLAGADTLVLHDGHRVQGRLVGVRDGAIEFENGWNHSVERYDRGDVDRIEIEGGRDYDRDRDGDHDRGDALGGRPSGMRERTVSVSARVPWSDTGIEVRRGQAVFFQARGRVHWGKDREDGPRGEDHSPRNPGRPIPDEPGAALIARVGGDDPFLVGDNTGSIRVRSSGRLQLGINDDYLLDNSGEFRVTIYY